MSSVSTKTIKLGDSADPSKNFLISVPSVPDGTLTIERENGTDVLTVDGNGKVNFPGNKQFLFIATRTGDQTLTKIVDDVLLFNTEQTDADNVFDPVTSRYQPTVPGWYEVRIGAYFISSTNGSPSAVAVSINKMGVGQTRIGFYGTVNALHYETFVNGSVLIYLNGTTDYVTVSAYTNYSSGDSLFKPAFSHFSANLVRAA